MSIKNFILLLFTALMVGCGPTVVGPSVDAPPAPTKSESAKPQLTKVSDGIEKAVSGNDKIADKADAQSKTISNQSVKIADAIAQSQRLYEKAKANQLISEIEAKELNTKLLEIRAENIFLTDQGKELFETIKNQGDLLQITRIDARQTLQQLDAVELELSKYRDLYKNVSETLKQRNKDVETLDKERLTLTKKAASAGVYKNWIIGIVSAFAVWTILKNILMVYFPATKFRI